MISTVIVFQFREGGCTEAETAPLGRSLLKKHIVVAAHAYQSKLNWIDFN
jgi:hypothetical protein